MTELGAAIADGAFASIAGVEPEEILMRYKRPVPTGRAAQRLALNMLC